MTILFDRVPPSLYIMHIKRNWLDYIVCIFNRVLNAICMILWGIQQCFQIWISHDNISWYHFTTDAGAKVTISSYFKLKKYTAEWIQWLNHEFYSLEVLLQVEKFLECENNRTHTNDNLIQLRNVINNGLESMNNCLFWTQLYRPKCEFLPQASRIYNTVEPVQPFDLNISIINFELICMYCEIYTYISYIHLSRYLMGSVYVYVSIYMRQLLSFKLNWSWMGLHENDLAINVINATAYTIGTDTCSGTRCECQQQYEWIVFGCHHATGMIIILLEFHIRMDM